MATNCKSGIYKIINIKSNDFYIGSSVNINKRKNNHYYYLNNNKHSNQHLQRAWNKYGKENFICEILEECDNQQLINKEQFYIDLLNPVYNICKIAYSTIGVTPNKETRLKMSKSRVGFKLSKESKLKISLAHKGRKYSTERNKQISEQKKKKVLQFDLEGNFIKEWSSGLEARVHYKSVYNALNGRYKTSNGYIWKYKLN